MNYYEQISRRRSFHVFRDTLPLSDADMAELRAFIAALRPLEEGIRTQIRIVPEKETSSKCGAEYCLLFYSEKKGDYLRNIGYLGEQIDLYLASRNIGALWLGFGRTKEKTFDGLDFVIMMAVSRVPAEKFRSAADDPKRKSAGEIWHGDGPDIARAVRLSPSAVNSQPWLVENTGGVLRVYRTAEGHGPLHIAADAMRYYNRIDIGIFLFILEQCLEHEGIAYERTLFADTAERRADRTIVAEYKNMPKKEGED